jgi:hypothetical protein
MKMNPLVRRIEALKTLLALERPTTKAIPYCEWIAPPIINIETEQAQKLYNITEIEKNG